ncbi:MAG: PrgI family protein [Candidatus Pacebacteria bacterium]|nr:PrgI family protein [Candidatus Paceibacterota bacterium]
MRFEVPQFIEIEDKIFGPLSWRQFLYIGGGVGMAVVLFLTTNLIVFVFLGLPLAILAGALAFYPVNNRPFSFFLEAIFNYLTNQRLYLWKQRSDIVHKASLPAAPSMPYNTTSANQPGSANKKDIASLARRLELQALQKTE